MTDSRPDLDDLAAFAGTLADAAGSAILPHFRQSIAVHDKAGQDDFDPVTEADRAGEAAMRRLIEDRFPDHGIVGEEFDDKPSASGLSWVLDPIDGTRAFICGLPLWGTLIALADGGRPVLGVVDQPYLKERFVGMGASATLNGRPLRTRACGDLGQAALSTTGIAWFTPAEQAAFLAVEARARLTRYGYDCYAYCMVAHGFLDLVVEAGLQPYDIQALIPIIEGAGGVVTDWSGGDAAGGGQIIAAGDRRVHAQALEVLRGAMG